MLKVTKNQGFNLSPEDTLLEKPPGESNWPLPRRLRVNIRLSCTKKSKTLYDFQLLTCITKIQSNILMVKSV